MVAVFYFESTGDAYDACQCCDDIKTGDVLVITPEKVIGIADTWPLAVTSAHGHLHCPAKGYTVETACTDNMKPGLPVARQLMKTLGFA